MSGMGLDPGWMWLIGGVILLIAEVIAPGFFLIFLGAAAIATGIFAVLFDLGTAPQLALFALYALLAVMIGRRFYANRATDGSHPHLNDPAVGRGFPLYAPRAASRKVRHGSRVPAGGGYAWRARC